MSSRGAPSTALSAAPLLTLIALIQTSRLSVVKLKLSPETSGRWGWPHYGDGADIDDGWSAVRAQRACNGSVSPHPPYWKLERVAAKSRGRSSEQIHAQSRDTAEDQGGRCRCRKRASETTAFEQRTGVWKEPISRQDVRRVTSSPRGRCRRALLQPAPAPGLAALSRQRRPSPYSPSTLAYVLSLFCGELHVLPVYPAAPYAIAGATTPRNSYSSALRFKRASLGMKHLFDDGPKEDTATTLTSLGKTFTPKRLRS